MAKYQFADQARRVLEENGVVVNDDGTTGFAKQPEQVVVGGEPQQTEAQKEQPTQTEAPAQAEQATQAEKDERDRLIEMQRRELEELRAKANQAPAQTQPAKSERETE